MIVQLGAGALAIAFVTALYGIFAAVNSVKQNSRVWLESARLAMLLTFPLISISALCLITLLLTGHYEVEFVYNVSSNSLPAYLKVTALWGGQAGSLLLWLWLLSGVALMVALRSWKQERDQLPWVIVVILATVAFFLGLAIFVDNPFVRFWQTTNGDLLTALFQPTGTYTVIPPDGLGLNPLLRHPGMIFHPPMLYLGFVAFVVPYAFAMAALITGRRDAGWIRLTRGWSLVAWTSLSLGLLLGSRWSYDVLGWGGYWSWDPVEVAALMPWLSGAAFLHSALIEEKRGQFKRWNVVLAVLTYSLVILGVFLTRSGMLSSVHAFSQSSIGPLFFGFIAVSLLCSTGLLIYRWNDLQDEASLGSFFSRESLFLFNNLLFMGLVAVCFWGDFFPLASELFTGQKMTVGPAWFKQTCGPLFAGLLFLMGIAPLSAWGYSTAKTLGRMIWKPALAAVLLTSNVYAVGIHTPLALVGFGLVILNLCCAFYEIGINTVARRKRTHENYLVSFLRLLIRNRRRYGSLAIHLGITLMALGIIGMEFFQSETQATIPVNGKIELDGYTLTYRSMNEYDTKDGRNVISADVMVEKGGKTVAELTPRRDYYYESQQSLTVPGVHGTLADDVYVILVDWQPISNQAATFKVYHNPLINWLWIGGIVLILGAIWSAWPERHDLRISERLQLNNAN